MADEGPTAADDVLSSIANELYGGSPANFTARRGARDDQIKRDGDPALAATIRGWRKPSVGAWLVDLLARARPDDMNRLVDLGEELRAAQAAMDGPPARAWPSNGWRCSATSTPPQADLARDAGQGMSDAIQRQVQSTLQAALRPIRRLPTRSAPATWPLPWRSPVSGLGGPQPTPSPYRPKARASRTTPLLCRKLPRPRRRGPRRRIASPPRTGPRPEKPPTRPGAPEPLEGQRIRAGDRAVPPGHPAGPIVRARAAAPRTGARVTEVQPTRPPDRLQAEQDVRGARAPGGPSAAGGGDAAVRRVQAGGA